MLLNGDGNESSPGGKIDQKFKFLKHIFDAKNFDLNFIKNISRTCGKRQTLPWWKGFFHVLCAHTTCSRPFFYQYIMRLFNFTVCFKTIAMRRKKIDENNKFLMLKDLLEDSQENLLETSSLSLGKTEIRVHTRSLKFIYWKKISNFHHQS